ncbi:MAG: YbjN domain-containing protein [Christensenellales bacterium]
MDKQLKKAREVYEYLCNMCDNMDLKYSRIDDELAITFDFSGEDLPMSFILYVEQQRQYIGLVSRLPFSTPEDKMVEVALAVTAINFRMPDGQFDFDIEEGKITFKMTSSYRESLLGEEVFKYMIGWALNVVEKYNDQLFMIGKGVIDIKDFLSENTD